MARPAGETDKLQMVPPSGLSRRLIWSMLFQFRRLGPVRISEAGLTAAEHAFVSRHRHSRAKS